ncbi:MAG: outer membrane lipoprotein LolB [Comamonas sp.]|nr:outer membrane lipoprotein LolB [Comamonas sp.]
MRVFSMARRTATIIALGFILLGCSTPPPSKLPLTDIEHLWSGRLGLQVHDPMAQEQSFSASFQLKGSTDQGSLDVFTPLGSQLAKLEWHIGAAQLQQGNRITRSESLQELLQLSLGTALPIQAMFEWLEGRPADASGWVANLSRYSDGRIAAQRTHPLPQATLRIVLDQP